MKKIVAMFSLLIMLLLLAVLAPEASAAAFSGGTGTAQDPYRISKAADLWEMADKINHQKTVETYAAAHYRLTADIDLGGRKEWTPIGYYSQNREHYRFEGTFDGDGHTIRGIRIRYKDPLLRRKRSLFGLFGQLEGTVQNLTISDSSIFAEGEQAVRVGAVAGEVRNGAVVNCHTTDSVQVTGNYASGGICGRMDRHSTLSGCTNAAAVTASGTIGNAGGIVEYAGCPVTDCLNTGRIVSREGMAAGIAANACDAVTDCENSGEITAEEEAAGIVCIFRDGAVNPGMNDGTITLLRCTNSGKVTSTTKIAGGIAAGCRTGRIADCVNAGPVTAAQEAGGIFAFFQQSAFGEACEVFTVSGCKNSGRVLSLENAAAGGICGMIYEGETRLVFENCVNSGDVEAGGRENVALSGAEAGGILGEGCVASLEVRGCRNSGAVQGNAVSGGILGRITAARDVEAPLLYLQDCENSGAVCAMDPGGLNLEIYAGGIIGSCREETEDPELFPAFSEVRMEDCKNTGKLGGEHQRAGLVTDDLCASRHSRLE